MAILQCRMALDYSAINSSVIC